MSLSLRSVLWLTKGRGLGGICWMLRTPTLTTMCGSFIRKHDTNGRKMPMPFPSSGIALQETFWLSPCSSNTIFYHCFFSCLLVCLFGGLFNFVLFLMQICPLPRIWKWVFRYQMAALPPCPSLDASSVSCKQIMLISGNTKFSKKSYNRF